jgi:hypothetical protein
MVVAATSSTNHMNVPALILVAATCSLLEVRYFDTFPFSKICQPFQRKKKLNKGRKKE